jgi:5,10-methylenetetrahydrofolate reductase
MEQTSQPEAIADARIRDLLRDATTPVVSIEFYPPKTSEGVDSLFKNLTELLEMRPQPLFVDFTWG